MATITDIRDVRERELTWPESRPRTSSRRNSSFYNTEVDKCERQVIAEIERLRPLDFVISRNRQRHLAGDPGVAVWWVDRKSKELRVLASDRYHTMAENLRALALTLEAMRALDRWGVYTLEQAVEGARAALPPPDSHKKRAWWEILEVGSNWPLEAIELKYQRLAKEAHPDAGGSGDRMAELNSAIAEARKAVQG